MKSKLPAASSVVGLAFDRAIARLEDLREKFYELSDFEKNLDRLVIYLNDFEYTKTLQN